MPKITQKCKGYEVFQRMNYLFQIRDLMAAYPMMSTYYGNLIINIAKKSVLRIDPFLKRQICKRCRGPLLPGQTAKVKVRGKKKSTMVMWQCMQCKFVKNYPASSSKKMWLEQPESVIEKLEYTQSESNQTSSPNNGKFEKKEDTKLIKTVSENATISVLQISDIVAP